MKLKREEPLEEKKEEDSHSRISPDEAEKTGGGLSTTAHGWCNILRGKTFLVNTLKSVVLIC